MVSPKPDPILNKTALAGAGLTNTSHLLTSFLLEYCGLLTRFIISSQARGVPQGGLNEAEEINPFIQQIFTVLE